MNNEVREEVLRILDKLVASLGEISDNLHDCTLEIEAIIAHEREKSSHTHK